ncbi:hypothetical protein BGX27_009072 [Mortierella sp. AM989]|nr:hypothetical protein BGX27_009072 [Mortierella sp. AM989]
MLSALLKATLTLSRHNWTHTAFTRFIPEPAARGSGGRKYASEFTPVGQYVLCIGPHIFLDTKFFTVFNPPPPSPSQLIPPLSSSATPSTATTPTEVSPSPVSTAGSAASPAPERVIELIMASTSSMAAEAAAAGSVPGTLAPGLIDPSTVTQKSRLNDSAQMSTPTADTSNEEDQSSQLKLDAAEKTASISRQTTPPPSGTQTKASTPRPHRPKHQVAFEFKENSGVRWLFPHESSLELMPAEGGDPTKISASFYLPITEGPRIGLGVSGLSAISEVASGPGQATTVVILQATTELWAGLQQSVSDPAATYRIMMERMKNIPPRVYVQYNLPIDLPDEQLLNVGLKELSDNHVVPLTTLDLPKRKLDILTEQNVGAKTKRPKAIQDEKLVLGSKGGTPVKKASATFNSSTTPPHLRQCAYCGCTSTPTWRRGPDGPHTLCNACGVKWRQGRIFIDTAPAITPPPEIPAPIADIPTTASPLPIPGPDALTTTAEAAARMCQDLSKLGGTENNYMSDETLLLNNTAIELKALYRHELKYPKRQGSSVSTDGSSSGDVVTARNSDGEKILLGKKRGVNKAAASVASGPKLVPIHQIGGNTKLSGKTGASLKKGKEKGKGKDKDKDKDRNLTKDSDKETSDRNPSAASSNSRSTGALVSTSTKDASPKTSVLLSDTSSPAASPTAVNSASSSPESGSKTSVSSTGKIVATVSTVTKSMSSKSATAGAKGSSKQKTSNSSTTPTTTSKCSLPATTAAAAANLSILKTLTGAPRYQSGNVARTPSINLADDGLSLYATKNLYTNNTATFPLHFPTISIAFGPNNAYYMYPNCAVVLFENHFQIKLIHSGERTDIDVRKEGIEGTEFQVVDVGDGESMIVMKAQLRQHLSRFQKDLLNPDKNEASIVFRFRERLDGGGPPVKPLLEQWLTTEIPVAGSPDK